MLALFLVLTCFVMYCVCGCRKLDTPAGHAHVTMHSWAVLGPPHCSPGGLSTPAASPLSHGTHSKSAAVSDHGVAPTHCFCSLGYSARFTPCVTLFCCQHWHNLGPEVFQLLVSTAMLVLHGAHTDFEAGWF